MSDPKLPLERRCGVSGNLHSTCSSCRVSHVEAWIGCAKWNVGPGSSPQGVSPGLNERLKAERGIAVQLPFMLSVELPCPE